MLNFSDALDMMNNLETHRLSLGCSLDLFLSAERAIKKLWEKAIKDDAGKFIVSSQCEEWNTFNSIIKKTGLLNPT